jgi:hypothetical protein
MGWSGGGHMEEWEGAASACTRARGGQAAGNAVHLAKAGHEVHARAGDGPEGEVWYGLRAHGPAW